MLPLSVIYTSSRPAHHGFGMLHKVCYVHRMARDVKYRNQTIHTLGAAEDSHFENLAEITCCANLACFCPIHNTTTQDMKSMAGNAYSHGGGQACPTTCLQSTTTSNAIFKT